MFMKNRDDIQASDGFPMKTSYSRDTFLVAIFRLRKPCFLCSRLCPRFKSNNSSLVMSHSTGITRKHVRTIFGCLMQHKVL